MKNLEYLLIPYELAFKLKEKGFNEPCLSWHDSDAMDNDEIEWETTCNSDLSYKKNCALPIYQQVIDWLDETHKIRICLSTAKTSGKYRYDIFQFIGDKWEGDYNLSSFYTRTERNIKAINEALELI